MKPTEILSSEHRVIEQVLDCLDKIITAAQHNHKLDGASATDAINFFRTFADQCHHGKEEAHLFPALEAKGFARDSGPTGVMLAEHTQGRNYIRQMNAAVAAAAQGESAAVQQFVEAGQHYSQLLRQHIQKEDHCLFSLADQALSAADQAVLLEKFAAVEAAQMGAGTHEKFLGIASALAKKFGVTVRVEPLLAGCQH